MRIVVLEGTEDPLSIVSIPPNKTSSEPIPWKQGKLLGKGAFGAVYMAMTGHGELIAVKRIDLAAAGKELTESFQVESDLLQRLDHPNIVRFVASKVKYICCCDPEHQTLNPELGDFRDSRCDMDGIRPGRHPKP